jgi:hypothetical protein
LKFIAISNFAGQHFKMSSDFSLRSANSLLTPLWRSEQGASSGRSDRGGTNYQANRAANKRCLQTEATSLDVAPGFASVQRMFQNLGAATVNLEPQLNYHFM